MSKSDKKGKCARRPGPLASLVVAVVLCLGTADSFADTRDRGLLASILADSYQFDTVQRIVDRSATEESPGNKKVEKAIVHARLNAGVVKRIDRYRELIASYSAKYDVDANLVKAVIYAESGGDPLAVSPKGATGLMQLMPATAAELGVADSFDPEQNIASGTRYLGELIERYKSVPVALWAYNAGPRAVKAGNMPQETQDYVPQVLKLKGYLAEGAGE